MYVLVNTAERLIDHARLVPTFDDTGNMLRTLCYILIGRSLIFVIHNPILQIQRNIEGYRNFIRLQSLLW